MENKVKLVLVGLDGNAFSILGAFKRAARQQGFPREWTDGIVREAMSGDYDHLLATIASNCEDNGMDNEDGCAFYDDEDSH